MKMNQRLAKEDVSGYGHAAPPRSYVLLMRVSRRLGSLATKSFVEIKSLLQPSVDVNARERFLRGMPVVRPTQVIGSTSARDKAASDALSYEDKKNIERNYEALDSAANLRQVVEQSHEVLVSVSTVFPVTLFPDTVFLDRTKVTIIRRSFFWSEDVLSIRIEDVLNVSASVGPLFGSLTIASRVMSTTDHFQIDFFWRNDAMHLKHIIQGYVIAQHNNLDTTNLSKEELLYTLAELGHDSAGRD